MRLHGTALAGFTLLAALGTSSFAADSTPITIHIKKIELTRLLPEVHGVMAQCEIKDRSGGTVGKELSATALVPKGGFATGSLDVIVNVPAAKLGTVDSYTCNLVAVRTGVRSDFTGGTDGKPDQLKDFASGNSIASGKF